MKVPKVGSFKYVYSGTFVYMKPKWLASIVGGTFDGQVVEYEGTMHLTQFTGTMKMLKGGSEKKDCEKEKKEKEHVDLSSPKKGAWGGKRVEKWRNKIIEQNERLFYQRDYKTSLKEVPKDFLRRVKEAEGKFGEECKKFDSTLKKKSNETFKNFLSRILESEIKKYAAVYTKQWDESKYDFVDRIKSTEIQLQGKCNNYLQSFTKNSFSWKEYSQKVELEKLERVKIKDLIKRIQSERENGRDIRDYCSQLELMLIEYEFDPSFDDNFVIRWACTNGYLAIIRIMLEESDSIDPSVQENICLREASRSGNLKIVQYLISDKRVNPSDYHNQAIRYASGNGHLQIVKILLNDERVDPSYYHKNATLYPFAIGAACLNGHFEIVKLLLSDERVDPSDCDNYSLRISISNGREKIVKFLLKDNRVNPPDDSLVLACKKNDTKIANLLLQDKRIDLTVDENFVLRWACKNGYCEIVQCLISDKQVNPSDCHNQAIRYASGDGHLHIVKILLNDKRVDPSYYHKNATLYPFAIGAACLNGHFEIVKLLLSDERVDPSDCDNYSLRIACRKNHMTIVNLLLQDTRVDPTIDVNFTLRWACKNGHGDIVQILLSDNRVDPSAVNNSPIRWAAKNGFLDIFRLLLTHKGISSSDDRLNDVFGNKNAIELLSENDYEYDLVVYLMNEGRIIDKLGWETVEKVLCSAFIKKKFVLIRRILQKIKNPSEEFLKVFVDCFNSSSDSSNTFYSPKDYELRIQCLLDVCVVLERVKVTLMLKSVNLSLNSYVRVLFLALSRIRDIKKIKEIHDLVMVKLTNCNFRCECYLFPSVMDILKALKNLVNVRKDRILLIVKAYISVFEKWKREVLMEINTEFFCEYKKKDFFSPKKLKIIVKLDANIRRCLVELQDLLKKFQQTEYCGSILEIINFFSSFVGNDIKKMESSNVDKRIWSKLENFLPKFCEYSTNEKAGNDLCVYVMKKREEIVSNCKKTEKRVAKIFQYREYIVNVESGICRDIISITKRGISIESEFLKVLDLLQEKVIVERIRMVNKRSREIMKSFLLLNEIKENCSNLFKRINSIVLRKKYETTIKNIGDHRKELIKLKVKDKELRLVIIYSIRKIKEKSEIKNEIDFSNPKECLKVIENLISPSSWGTTVPVYEGSRKFENFVLLLNKIRKSLDSFKERYEKAMSKRFSAVLSQIEIAFERSTIEFSKLIENLMIKTENSIMFLIHILNRKEIVGNIKRKKFKQSIRNLEIQKLTIEKEISEFKLTDEEKEDIGENSDFFDSYDQFLNEDEGEDEEDSEKKSKVLEELNQKKAEFNKKIQTLKNEKFVLRRKLERIDRTLHVLGFRTLDFIKSKIKYKNDFTKFLKEMGVFVERVLDDYEELKEISVSDRGKVYCAKLKSDFIDEYKILKVLNYDPVNILMTQNEIKNLVKLQSNRAIVPIRSVFYFQKKIVLEMDFYKSDLFFWLRGVSFMDKNFNRFEMIKKCEKMKTVRSKEEIFQVFKLLLEGIAFIHKNKVQHRDLKPQNIIINDIFDVKIIDFGISRDSNESLTITKNNFAASVRYLSPEANNVLQNRLRSKSDKTFVVSDLDYEARDMYAFGLMLLESLLPVKFYENLPSLLLSLPNLKPTKDDKSEKNFWNVHLSLIERKILCRFLTLDPKKRISAQSALTEINIFNDENKKKQKIELKILDNLEFDPSKVKRDEHIDLIRKKVGEYYGGLKKRERRYVIVDRLSVKGRKSIGRDVLKQLTEGTTNLEELLSKVTTSFIGEDGIDAGGVTRVLFSEFFEQFSSNEEYLDLIGSNQMFGNLYLPSDRQDLTDVYFLLGKLFLKCLLENRSTKISFGPLFFSYILNQEPKKRKDWIKYCRFYDPTFIKLTQSQVYDEKMFNSFVECEETFEDDDGLEIRVSESNKSEYLYYAISFIKLKGVNGFRVKNIESFKKGFYQFLPKELKLLMNNLLNPFEMEYLFYGDRYLSIETFLNCFNFNKFKKIPEYFKVLFSCPENEKENEEEVKHLMRLNFIRYCCGSINLIKGVLYKDGKPQKIYVRKSNVKDRFKSHTCGYTLDIGENYDEEGSFEGLKKKIDLVMSHFKVSVMDG